MLTKKKWWLYFTKPAALSLFAWISQIKCTIYLFKQSILLCFALSIYLYFTRVQSHKEQAGLDAALTKALWIWFGQQQGFSQNCVLVFIIFFCFFITTVYVKKSSWFKEPLKAAIYQAKNTRKKIVLIISWRFQR